jgi:hypothetical protein
MQPGPKKQTPKQPSQVLQTLETEANFRYAAQLAPQTTTSSHGFRSSWFEDAVMVV